MMKLKTSVLAAAVASVLPLFAEMEPATPESQGVDSKGILAFLDAAEKQYDGENRRGRLHGFVIVRHGKVIAEGSWKPFDTLNSTHMLYSHSKSFTATAVGFLVDEGKIDLDERVVELFPEDVPAKLADERMRELRIRDLLTMNVGADLNHDVARGDDWLKRFFARRLDRQPGTGFKYDSDATYVLAAIVEKKSGKKLMDFLKERLFSKIGIEKAWSTVSPQGIACGGWGMNMTTRELARFGQFCLQEGRWGDRQLLSRDWMRLATTRQTWSGWINIGSKAIGEGTDWEQGYGFQFWRCHHGAYRCDGAAGQFTVVLPEQDAVVSINAGLSNMQQELNLIWNHLLPAMKPAALPENAPAQAELAQRCAGLAIPPVAGGKDGADVYLGKYSFDPNERGIRAIELYRDQGTLKMFFYARFWTTSFPIGFGEWKQGGLWYDGEKYEGLGALIGWQKTAASAAVQADGSLKCRVYLTGGTHYLDFHFSMKDGDPVFKGEHWGMKGCKFTGRIFRDDAQPKDVPPLTDDAAAVRKFYAENMYGIREVERPADLAFKVVAENECLGGTAVHQAVEISCKGPYAPFSFVADAYFPKGKKNVPAFVAMNFEKRLKKGEFDPFADNPGVSCWPVDDLIRRGFATIGFTYTSVVDDNPATCFDSGLFKAFGPKPRRADSWGALSAWSWAASRCVDWLEQQDWADLKRVGVVGHSRLGKTALWAGVTDSRFALACPNDSGCCGARINHIDLPFAESFDAIYTQFPHWFAPNLRKWLPSNGKAMPFDQHNLVAAVAPRRVAVGSGTEDHWAGPPGERFTAELAAPAWEKLGLKGFGEGVRHHYRKGPHDITPEDWAHYMDAL